MKYYTILYNTILYYTILYHTIPYHTTLHYTILYYTILHYTILILYYTILCYTTLHYTTLCYTIPRGRRREPEPAGGACDGARRTDAGSGLRLNQSLSGYVFPVVLSCKLIHFLILCCFSLIFFVFRFLFVGDFRFLLFSLQGFRISFYFVFPYFCFLLISLGFRARAPAPAESLGKYNT